MTFSCVQIRWKSQGLLIFWSILFLLTIIPQYQGAKLIDYDLLLANGNSIMFFKDSMNSSLNLPLVRKESNGKERNSRIMSVVSDISNDVIYYTIIRSNKSAIAMYNLRDNQTTEIYSINEPKGIGSLTLNKNYLYWTFNRSVVKMAIMNESVNVNETISYLPELVFTDKNSTMESFVIHPFDGTIYYTNWRKGQGSQILFYKGLAEDQENNSSNTNSVTNTFGNVFVDDVSQPKGLFVDSLHLYWISNPPGIFYQIERANLKNMSKIDVLHRSSGRHPYALAVNCSKEIYLSDVMNRVMWDLDLKADQKEDLTKIVYFPEKDRFPYGISLINKYPSSCETENTQDISTTTAPSIRNSVIKDCIGQECIKNSLSKDMAKTGEQIITGNVFSAEDKYKEGTNINSSFGVGKFNSEICSTNENPCLNGASCLKVDSRIFCLCQPEYSGLTCAQSVAKEGYEVVKERASIERFNQSSSSLSSWSSSNNLFFLSSIVLSSVVLILLVVIAVLLVKIRKLDKKPRIRRRVLVSHRSDIDNNPSSVCEMIDIENCCNMNICETPCYERMTGAAGSSSSSSSISFGRSRKNSVKEDKKCLLSS